MVGTTGLTSGTQVGRMEPISPPKPIQFHPPQEDGWAQSRVHNYRLIAVSVERAKEKNYPYGKKTKEKYKNGSFQSSTNRIDREDRERRGRKKE